MTHDNEYILYIELPKQPATIHFGLILRQWKEDEWAVHTVNIEWVNENPNNADGGYFSGSYHSSLGDALKAYQKRLQDYINQYAMETLSDEN